MAKNTSVNMSKIEKKDMENSFGQMANATRENGEMVNNMEMDY